MNTFVENSLLTKADMGRILEDVNSIRLAIGIGEGKIPELPKGRPGDASQCVLARALSNGWEPDIETDRIRLSNYEPDVLKTFDFEKVVSTLRLKGLEASYEVDEWEGERESCWITITPTEEMQTLIRDFDNGFLPSLILKD